MKPKFQQRKVQNPSFPILILKLSKDLEETSQQDANFGILHLPYLKTSIPTYTYCLPSDSDISDSDNCNTPIKTNLFAKHFCLIQYFCLKAVWAAIKKHL